MADTDRGAAAAPDQAAANVAARGAKQGSHGGNVALLRRENCAQMFFIYAGGLGMIDGFGPMAFLQKSGLTDRNVAFVRDPDVIYFEKGFSEEVDTLDKVIDWHGAHLAANPHVTEVYCLGNSFGGWASLFFGYLLGVKHVWSLAPAGTWGLGLLKDMMDDPNGVTGYDIYYSGQEAKDAHFAETLAPYPGVRTHRRDEHGHLMIRGMLQSGELPKVLPPFKAAGT